MNEGCSSGQSVVQFYVADPRHTSTDFEWCTTDYESLCLFLLAVGPPQHNPQVQVSLRLCHLLPLYPVLKLWLLVLKRLGPVAPPHSALSISIVRQRSFRKVLATSLISYVFQLNLTPRALEYPRTSQFV